MNHDLQPLHPYPFEMLNSLKAAVTPPDNLPHIALSIGEPKHLSPRFVTETLVNNIALLSNYPSTIGILKFLHTISHWAI